MPRRSIPLIERLEDRKLLAFLNPVTSFGENGFAGAGSQLVTGFRQDHVLLEQSSDKIVAMVDRTNDVYGENLDLIRFYANGRIDRSFGTNGYVDPGVTAARLLEAPGGKIVGVYRYEKRNSSYGGGEPTEGFGVFRLNPDGSTDTSFGVNGTATLKVATGYELYLRYDATIGADGSIYLISSDQFQRPGQKFVTRLTKLTPAGTIDTAWGNGGNAFIPSDVNNTTHAYARTIEQVIVREDGTLLMAGTEEHLQTPTNANNSTSFRARYTYVTRLRANGQPDPRFGRDGQYVIENQQARQYENSAVGLIRNPDESLILSFRSFGRQQFLNLSPSGRPTSIVRMDDVWESYSAGFYFALSRLSDGRLLRSGPDGMAEVRPLSDGRFETQPYRRPLDIEGKPITYSPEPIVLRDGSILTIGVAGNGGEDAQYTLIKLQPGDGTEKRDDFIPNAQQNALTESGEHGSGKLNVFFYDAATRTLGFRQRGLDGRWSGTQTIDNSRNAGIYLSAVGEAVAYCDGDKGDLKFAWRSRNGKWITETVDAKGSTGLYPSMVAYEGGYAIAYYNRSRGDLRLAKRNGTTGLWSIETIDAAGDVGRIPKLLVKQHNNQLAIAYATNGDRNIRLAEANVSTAPWTMQEVATTTGGVGKIDLDYDSFDYEFGPFSDQSLAAYVAYYDAGPADLVIARRPGLGQAFASFRVATRGAVGLTPDVQQSSGAATLFYERTRNRVLAAHVRSYPELSASVEDFTVVADAGPFFTSMNREGSRYELSVAWYDTVKKGLQIRDSGWYQ